MRRKQSRADTKENNLITLIMKTAHTAYSSRESYIKDVKFLLKGHFHEIFHFKLIWPKEPI